MRELSWGSFTSLAECNRFQLCFCISFYETFSPNFRFWHPADIWCLWSYLPETTIKLRTKNNSRFRSLPPQNFNVRRTFGEWPFKVSQTSQDEPRKYLKNTYFRLQIKVHTNFNGASETPSLKVPQNAWINLVTGPSMGLKMLVTSLQQAFQKP